MISDTTTIKSSFSIDNSQAFKLNLSIAIILIDTWSSSDKLTVNINEG